MWQVWPQNDGDSIQWIAPVARDQHDHDVDGRQRHDGQDPAASVGDLKSMTNHSRSAPDGAARLRCFEPHANGMSSRPSTTSAGHHDEDDEGAYGFSKRPEKRAMSRAMNAHRASPWSTRRPPRRADVGRARPGSHARLVTSGSACRRRARRGRRPAACRTSFGIGGFLVEFAFLAMRTGIDDPLPGCRRPRASRRRRRAGSSCRPCRRWNGTPTLLGCVHLLALLRILSACVGGRRGQRDVAGDEQGRIRVESSSLVVTSVARAVLPEGTSITDEANATTRELTNSTECRTPPCAPYMAGTCNRAPESSAARCC